MSSGAEALNRRLVESSFEEHAVLLSKSINQDALQQSQSQFTYDFS